ncbi:signal peptide peptidase SppA [Alkalicoccobacillus plakortidis]|uniref:Signal peptide peptidase SppA n=1 Tax=Alkalicoccobacillus plakortidis TaxID=444060 RepID=A0ABT0XH93_9BACI|nr:signal peptide peptidase SppA [Alkalicoccobacillus plakortidis]MCM2675290.1 signal peptide peptidase SppA [Alkalicoccobacillus plakortidis]
MNWKRWTALGVVAGLLIISTITNLAVGFYQIDFDDYVSSDFAETTIQDGAAGKVVVLNLDGVIQDTGAQGLFSTEMYDHQAFLTQIESAGTDPNVDGIIIRVNTPGGGVLESAEIHDKIVEAQELRDTPVYISMGNMAASGGYYIAASADRIVASPNTITGSIGVIMESINFSELAENYGVKFNTIKSGEFKDIMSPYKEMSDEERDILQSMVDESYEEFVRIIAEGRQMDESTVRDIADGRIYSGNQALENGLVDDLGDLEDTIDLLSEELGGGDYQVVTYDYSMGMYDFFGMTAQKMFGPDPELTVLQKLIFENRAPSLKYLYAE